MHDEERLIGVSSQIGANLATRSRYLPAVSPGSKTVHPCTATSGQRRPLANHRLRRGDMTKLFMAVLLVARPAKPSL